jgi:chromosome segregation ATPase
MVEEIKEPRERRTSPSRKGSPTVIILIIKKITPYRNDSADDGLDMSNIADDLSKVHKANLSLRTQNNKLIKANEKLVDEIDGVRKEFFKLKTLIGDGPYTKEGPVKVIDNKDELESLQKRLKEALDDNDRLKRAIEEIEDDINTYRTENNALKENTRKLAIVLRENEELERALGICRSDIDVIKQRHQEAIWESNQIRAEMDPLRSRLAEADRSLKVQVEKLTAKNQELQRLIEEFERYKQNAERDRASIKGENDSLKKSCQEFERSNRLISDKLMLKSQELERLLEDFEAIRASHERLSREKLELLSRMDGSQQVQSLLADMDKQINALHSKTHTMSTMNRDLEEENRKLLQDRRLLEEKLMESSKRTEEMKDINRGLLSQIEKLTMETQNLGRLSYSSNELKKIVLAKEAEIEALKINCIQMERDNGDIIKKLKDSDDDNEQLLAKIAYLEDTLAKQGQQRLSASPTHQAELVRAQQVLTEAESEMANLRIDNQRIQNAMIGATDENNLLKQKIARLDMLVVRLTSELDISKSALDQAVSSVSHVMTDAGNKNIALRETLSRLEADLRSSSMNEYKMQAANKDLLSALDQAKDVLLHQESELGSTKSELKYAQQRLKNAEEEIRELSKIAEGTVENKWLKDKIVQQAAKIAELEASSSKLIRTVDMARSALENATERSNRAWAETSAKNAQLADTVARLEAEAAGALHDQDRLRARNKELLAELAHAKDDLARLHDVLGQNKSELKQTALRLQHAESEASQLRSGSPEKDALGQRLQEAQKRCGQLEILNAKLLSELDTFKAKSSSQQPEIASLQHQLSQAQLERTKLLGYNKDLGGILEAEKQKLNIAEIKLKTALSDNQQLEARVKKMNEELAEFKHLSASNASAEANRQRLIENERKLQAEVDRLANDNRNLNTKLKMAEQDLKFKQADPEKSVLTDKLTESSRRCQMLEETNARLQTDLQNAKNTLAIENQKQTKHVSELNSIISSLKEQLTKLESDINQHRSKEYKLEGTIVSTQKLLEDEARQRQQAQSDLQAAKADYRRCEGELRTLKEENRDLRQKNDGMQESGQLKDKIHQQAKIISQLEVTLVNVSSQLEVAKQALENAEKKVAQTISSQSLKQGALLDALSKLESELLSMQRNEQRTSTTYKELMDSLDKARAVVLQKESELSSVKSELISTKGELKLALDRVKSSQGELELADKAIKNKSTENEELQNRLVEQNKHIGRLDVQIKELTIERDNLKSALENATERSNRAWAETSAKNAQLADTVARLEAEAAGALHDQDRLRARNKELLAELAHAKDDLARLHDVLGQNKSELKQTTLRLQHAESEASQLRSGSPEKDALGQRLQEAQKRCGQLEVLNAKLQSEVESSQELINRQAKTIAENQAKIAEINGLHIRDRMIELETLLATGQRNEGRLIAQNKEFKNLAEEMREKLIQAEADIATLKSEVKRDEIVIKGLNEELRHARSINSLPDDRDGYRNKIREQADHINQLERDNIGLRSDLEGARTAANQAREQLSKLSTYRDPRTGAIEQENEMMRSKIGELTRVISNYEHIAEKLGADLEGARVAQQMNEERINKIHQELSMKNHSIKELILKIESLLRNEHTLTANNRDLLMALEHAQTAIHHLESELNGIRSEAKSSHDKLRRVQEELKDLLSRIHTDPDKQRQRDLIEELTRKISQYELTINRLNTSLASGPGQQAIDRLRAENQKLRQALDEAAIDLHKLKKSDGDVDRLYDENSDLNRENRRNREIIQDLNDHISKLNEQIKGKGRLPMAADDSDPAVLLRRFALIKKTISELYPQESLTISTALTPEGLYRISLDPSPGSTFNARTITLPGYLFDSVKNVIFEQRGRDGFNRYDEGGRITEYGRERRIEKGVKGKDFDTLLALFAPSFARDIAKIDGDKVIVKTEEFRRGEKINDQIILVDQAKLKSDRNMIEEQVMNDTIVELDKASAQRNSPSKSKGTPDFIYCEGQQKQFGDNRQLYKIKLPIRDFAHPEIVQQIVLTDLQLPTSSLPEIRATLHVKNTTNPSIPVQTYQYTRHPGVQSPGSLHPVSSQQTVDNCFIPYSPSTLSSLSPSSLSLMPCNSSSLVKISPLSVLGGLGISRLDGRGIVDRIIVDSGEYTREKREGNRIRIDRGDMGGHIWECGYTDTGDGYIDIVDIIDAGDEGSKGAVLGAIAGRGNVDYGVDRELSEFVQYIVDEEELRKGGQILIRKSMKGDAYVFERFEVIEDPGEASFAGRPTRHIGVVTDRLSITHGNEGWNVIKEVLSSQGRVDIQRFELPKLDERAILSKAAKPARPRNFHQDRTAPAPKHLPMPSVTAASSAPPPTRACLDSFSIPRLLYPYLPSRQSSSPSIFVFTRSSLSEYTLTPGISYCTFITRYILTDRGLTRLTTHPNRDIIEELSDSDTQPLRRYIVSRVDEWNDGYRVNRNSIWNNNNENGYYTAGERIPRREGMQISNELIGPIDRNMIVNVPSSLDRFQVVVRSREFADPSLYDKDHIQALGDSDLLTSIGGLENMYAVMSEPENKGAGHNAFTFAYIEGDSVVMDRVEIAMGQGRWEEQIRLAERLRLEGQGTGTSEEICVTRETYEPLILPATQLPTPVAHLPQVHVTTYRLSLSNGVPLPRPPFQKQFKYSLSRPVQSLPQPLTDLTLPLPLGHLLRVLYDTHDLNSEYVVVINSEGYEKFIMKSNSRERVKKTGDDANGGHTVDRYIKEPSGMIREDMWIGERSQMGMEVARSATVPLRRGITVRTIREQGSPSHDHIEIRQDQTPMTMDEIIRILSIPDGRPQHH